jgi:DNA-binding NarL/FixJ family response regulator
MTTYNDEVQGREQGSVPRDVALPVTFADVSSDVRRAIRVAAETMDANGSGEIEAATLWGQLARGECYVVEELFTGSRCYLVLAYRADEAVRPIEGRRLDILQAVLRGLPQTNVAIDFDLAPSTVALNSKLGLVNLGVAGKPSRVHPLLMLAARAASEPSVAVVSCASFAVADRPLRVIGARRPDRHLAKILPAAELAVIRRLVEGTSYAEIAAERGTSTRTIANQITAVFRRLHVSGRNELLHRLLLDEGLIRLLAKPLTEPTPPASTRQLSDWRPALRSA